MNRLGASLPAQWHNRIHQPLDISPRREVGLVDLVFLDNDVENQTSRLVRTTNSQEKKKRRGGGGDEKTCSLFVHSLLSLELKLAQPL